jgi:general secretion pathway protein D
MMKTRLLGSALAVPLLLQGCAAPPRPANFQTALAASVEPESEPLPQPEVRATIVGGEPRAAIATQSAAVSPRSGDISLNFPAADVRAVAKAVLGDILRVPFTVSPSVTAPVTVVTSRPIARSSVLAFFEEALKAAGVALVPQNGAFLLLPVDQARASGMVVGSQSTGYGTEIVQLEFVNADEMRKLLDPILPGVISQTDPSRNALVIAGTTGQRGSARELLKQFDVNWLRNMSFALFVPQRTDSRLIVPELEKLINAPDAPTKGMVRLIAMDRLNGILAVSVQRQYLEDVRRWIEILDREGQNSEPQLFVYRVQNGRSRDLAKTLNAAFGNASEGGERAIAGDTLNDRPIGQEPERRAPEAPGQKSSVPLDQPGKAGGMHAKITSDETNNALLVFGTPREYALIEEALRKLDVLPYQVLIEAAITEVSLNDDMRYGVQWNFQAGDTNFALTDGTGPNPTRVFPGFSFFYSNASDISATLNALEERTNIKVISAPKLLVLNNQTAALQVGDQVPVSTQSAVGVQNPDSPIVNTIEYRDTGVILKVTPRVNAGGLVLLDVAQEVSDVSATKTSDINSPTISTRRISTSIAVQDGQVIALGGLIRDSKSFGKTGLPLLSRLPLLGGLLFGRTNDTQRRTELIVLLKPRVIRTVEDGRAITEELRAKIRTLEPFRSTGNIP